MLVDENSAAGLLFGRITAVDRHRCRIRVRLDERGGVETFWVHVPQRNTHRNKHRSLPDMNAHVAILLAANGVDGVYLGSIYSDAEPPPVDDDSQEYVRFSDGTVASYDTTASVLRVECVGKVEVVTADTAMVQAGTSATVDTPEVKITGNTTVRKTLTVEGGMVIRGGSGSGGTVEVEGDFRITGNIAVDGNINASGSIMDVGGNSNHHSHS